MVGKTVKPGCSGGSERKKRAIFGQKRQLRRSTVASRPSNAYRRTRMQGHMEIVG